MLSPIWFSCSERFDGTVARPDRRTMSVCELTAAFAVGASEGVGGTGGDVFGKLGECVANGDTLGEFVDRGDTLGKLVASGDVLGETAACGDTLGEMLDDSGDTLEFGGKVLDRALCDKEKSSQ